MQETRVQSLSQEDPLEENMGIPLQYSSLEYPMDRGAGQAAVQRATRTWTGLKRLNMPTFLLAQEMQTGG